MKGDNFIADESNNFIVIAIAMKPKSKTPLLSTISNNNEVTPIKETEEGEVELPLTP